MAHTAENEKHVLPEFGKNPFVIDNLCKMSSCEASTMGTPPVYFFFKMHKPIFAFFCTKFMQKHFH